MPEKVELTVILPCYNEEVILEKNVKEIISRLKPTQIKFEVIIAEDGSKDRTEKIGKELSKKYKEVTFLHSKKRLGRGLAVSNAIKISKGKITGFIDTDLQTPPKYIIRCYNQVRKGYDAVEVIRRNKIKPCSSLRFFLSNVYRYLFKKMFNLGLEDTLAGCKFFRKQKILPVLDKIKDNHWFWDTEIMVLAFYEGLKTKEIPSEFLDDKNSKRKSKCAIISTAPSMLFKLFELKIRVNKIYNK